MRPRRMGIALILGFLTLTLAACGTKTITPSGAGNLNASSSAAKTKITLFSQQQLQTTAFEMAQEKGYFTAENLEVDIKYFASGTTALQTLKSGVGDIVFTGDTPAMNYWSDSGHAYQIIAPVERNAKGYQLITKAGIKSVNDLKGKTIATRVGSAGSHFTWALMKKYNLTDVKIINMDGPVAISALDRGDIDGFFLWAPFPARSLEVSGNKVHVLTDASEVVSGYYTLLGAKPEWVKANAGAVAGFLRAAIKGQEYVKGHRDEITQYLGKKFSMKPEDVNALWDNEEFLLKMDAGFFKDMEGIAGWANQEGTMKDKLDWNSFVYTNALKSIDAKLVEQPK